MKKSKTLIVVVLLIIGMAAIVCGVINWHACVVARRQCHALEVAKRLLNQGSPAGALAIIRQQMVTDTNQNWPILEIRALVDLRSAAELAAIYKQAPGRVQNNEEACVILARAGISSRNTQLFNIVRNCWRGRETLKAEWLVLESDAQLLAGKPGEAEEILCSQKFTGKAEAERLERLSLLVSRRDLPRAWQLLMDAEQIDPRNPEIRSFRGQILEAAGYHGAAKVEYTAAIVTKPQDPILFDQLAEFYRRQGKYDSALEVWQHCQTNFPADFIALKTAFWMRMISPWNINPPTIAKGELQPLACWITKLPTGKFFDNNSFIALPQARSLEQQRQEIFWLQLVEALKSHHENETATLLKDDRFVADSWQPDLRATLTQIINYRQTHRFGLEAPAETTASVSTNRHQLFISLARLAKQERADGRVNVPQDLSRLLLGPNAFASAFLAAGWREAALALCKTEKCEEEPVWFDYGLAMALRQNRGPCAARNFLVHQRPEPELILLAAELDIADGFFQEGLKRLPAVAQTVTDAGYRACCLLTLACLDTKKFDDARHWAQLHPRLAADITGHELLAQIALRSGHTNEAANIYQAILPHSSVAKLYFSQQAYDRHDLAEARHLTADLVRLMPDNLQLRGTLLAIDRTGDRK